MKGIWDAAEAGDLAEVQRLVGQDPGLLDATMRDYRLQDAPDARLRQGHVGVVRWLLDKGAAINERGYLG
jgi:hypothetical protein